MFILGNANKNTYMCSTQEFMEYIAQDLQSSTAVHELGQTREYICSVT